MTEPWIEKTQQTLGNLITRPKLTDKYLKKPPFRFLHDVISEVIRATSFGQGLYNSSEQDAGTIGDKQAKLDFLNKMISCVSFALAERLDVSANKIVAGLEPEKTNGFLVKLHEAATSKLDASPDAVQRVLQGDSAVVEKKKKDKEKKEKKEEDGAAADDAEAAAKEEERRKRKEEERAKRKEEERAKRKEEEEKARKAQEAADADADTKRKEEERARKKEEERAKRKEEERAKRKEEEKAAKEKAEKERAEKEKAAAAAPAPAAPVKASHDQAPPAPAEADERVELKPQEEPKRERPLTAGRKPPKITSKVRTKQDEPGMQAKVAEGPALITEDDGGAQDDDMFVQDAIDRPKEYFDEGQGGKLTRQLLEEKKKTANEQQEQAQEDEKKSGIRMGKLKRKKDASDTRYSEVDVGQLTGLIQQLCQTVNPLGKSIDMIYNDIAAMGKELEMWRAEHRTACERQQTEKEITEKEMAPLYTKLAQIEDSIAEQQSKTVAIRSRILQQDSQIHTLLETIAQAEGSR